MLVFGVRFGFKVAAIFAAQVMIEPRHEDILVLDFGTLRFELGAITRHFGNGARDKVLALLARRTHHSAYTVRRFFMT